MYVYQDGQMQDKLIDAIIGYPVVQLPTHHLAEQTMSFRAPVAWRGVRPLDTLTLPTGEVVDVVFFYHYDDGQEWSRGFVAINTANDVVMVVDVGDVFGGAA